MKAMQAVQALHEPRAYVSKTDFMQSPDQSTGLSKRPSVALLRSKKRVKADNDPTLLEGARRVQDFMYASSQDQKCCDLLVKASGGDIYAHSVAFGAYSDTLAGSFYGYNNGEMITLDLTEYRREVVLTILHFLYTTELQLNCHIIGQVLSCVTKLGMEFLVEKCMEYLKDVSVDNAVLHYSIAENNNIRDLRDKLLEFILENFSEVYLSKHFVYLPLERLISILKHQNLKVTEEAVVFRAVVRWVDHDRAARIGNSTELLKCVRFQLISAELLASEVEDADWIFVYQELWRECLYSAMKYNALHSSENTLSNSSHDIQYLKNLPSRQKIPGDRESMRGDADPHGGLQARHSVVSQHKSISQLHLKMPSSSTWGSSTQANQARSLHQLPHGYKDLDPQQYQMAKGPGNSPRPNELHKHMPQYHHQQQQQQIPTPRSVSDMTYQQALNQAKQRLSNNSVNMPKRNIGSPSSRTSTSPMHMMGVDPYKGIYAKNASGNASNMPITSRPSVETISFATAYQGDRHLDLQDDIGLKRFASSTYGLCLTENNHERLGYDQDTEYVRGEGSRIADWMSRSEGLESPRPVVASRSVHDTRSRHSIGGALRKGVGGSQLIAVGGINLTSENPDYPGRVASMLEADDGGMTGEGERWRDSPAMLPSALHHHGVVALDGKIYVIGGAICGMEGSVATSAVSMFDGREGKWKPVESLPQPRAHLGVACWRKMIFAVCGENDKREKLDTVVGYDTERKGWMEVTRMIGGGRVGPAVAVHQDGLFVVGGYNKTPQNNSGVLHNVSFYDLLYDNWIELCPLEIPRCYANLVSVDGTMLLVGGRTCLSDGSIASLSTILQYDVSKDEWEERTNMKQARHDMGCAAIGSMLYIVGGIKSPKTDCMTLVECYNLQTDHWVSGIAPYPYPTAGLGLVAVPNPQASITRLRSISTPRR